MFYGERGRSNHNHHVGRRVTRDGRDGSRQAINMPDVPSVVTREIIFLEPVKASRTRWAEGRDGIPAYGQLITRVVSATEPLTHVFATSRGGGRVGGGGTSNESLSRAKQKAK